MCKQEFVHLHAHTHYSVQDALPSPKNYAKKARAEGFIASAITDHGRMGGVVEFVEACRADDGATDPIKPIIGCEVYTCPDMTFKEHAEREDGTVGRPKHNHLTLLAMNEKGYRNLLNIASIGAEVGYYYDPRVDWKVIEEHNEGIIALSGCLASELNQALLRHGEKKAESVAERFLDVFGDRYYIEIQNHGIPEQEHNLPKLLELGKKYDIPVVASNDVHYLEQKDWQIHDVLIQMRDLSQDRIAGKKNGKKEAYGTHNFHLKTRNEMENIFSSVPYSLDNTLNLTDRVEDFMKLDVPHLLPSAYVPMNDEDFRAWWQRNLKYYKPNEAYLAYLAFNGLKRLGLDKNSTYIKRMKYEWETVCNMGVVDYFLIEYEMVCFMKKSNIRYGIRGSGVGSLLNYLLEVCSVDPIRWNLMFERFLNPGRGEQYKIDFSVMPVKEYQEQKGKEDQSEAVRRLKEIVKEKSNDPEYESHMPAIHKEIWVLENQGLATYMNHLSNSGITKQKNESNSWIAYFLGITDEKPESGLKVKKVATLPDVDTDIDDSRRSEAFAWASSYFGQDKVKNIGTWGTYGAKAAVIGVLKTSEKFNAKWKDKTHQMAQVVSKTIPGRPGTTLDDALQESPEFASWARQYPEEIAIARKLVGTISNLGVHAGGILIANDSLCNHVPIENSKGTLCSGYDMKSVERVGAVKYDYLGLSTLHTLSYALELIKKRHGKDIDPADIPLEDPKVFKNIYATGKTSTVFQFASGGMQKALQDVNASNTEDLIAVAALYRPGPMAYIPDYALGKKNPDAIKYDHPIIKKHLEVTYGIMVYQEQAMFLARDLAGFDWDETDKLRKAVSKKDPVLFDKITKLFREKAIARGVDAQVVNNLLQLMEKFSGYAFNRSHACAYAILSYWTAWLRYYYPSEWMAACLQTDQNDETKKAIYEKECKTERINVLNPNVNESGMQTTVNKHGDILMPLTSIKGVGSMAETIIANQPYESLKQLCWVARPNRGTVESLFIGGALDCFPEASKTTETEVFMEIWDELVHIRGEEEKRLKKQANMKYKSTDSLINDSDDLDSIASKNERTSIRNPIVKKTKPRINTRNFFGDE